MRSLAPLPRGSANWPFIIALLALLVFVYLWFDVSDQRDKMKLDKEKVEKQRDENSTLVREGFTGWNDLATLVGWRSVQRKVGIDEYALTDNTKLKAQLDENEMDGDRPGIMNFLIHKTNITLRRDMRSAKAAGAEEKPATFEWMSADFRVKVQEASRLAGLVPPVPATPADPDDSVAQAKYNAAKAAYDAAVAQLQASVTQLQATPGWKQYSQVIRGSGIWDPDRTEMVTVNYYKPPAAPVATVENAMALPQDVIALALDEFGKNKSADQGLIDTQKADLVVKEAQIAADGVTLKTEQEAHVATRTTLTAEVATANETTERVRQQGLAAEKRAKEAETDKSKVEVLYAAQKAAYESRIANDKQVLDLRIRRDDPDGHVLSASGTLRTGTIDIGSADHVTPGLKLTVSYIDRGGDRQAKGEVMVLQVTGAHSSKVTILSSTSSIVTGDTVSNPFFDAKDAIHVWFYAGKPDEIAMARLTQIGVIVDANPSAKTAYLIIPNDMTAAAAAPAPDAAAPAAGDDPLSRVEKMARPFGATVITQRMLDHFVNP